MLKNNLKANKSLGQHFLKDEQICDRIASSCGPLNEAAVLEIGPGTGNLTKSIMSLHSGVEVTAVETDKRFTDMLNSIGNCHQNSKLHIIQCDALQYDLNKWITQDKKKYIISNLPYNIGTELLFRWLNSPHLQEIQSINVMLQKEVVDRIIATCNTKKYSWLSIISQLLCDVELLFDVPKEAFTPQPKVISSVVSLQPKKKTLTHSFDNLQNICRRIFLHRRKTIGNIIKNDIKLSYLLPILKETKFDLRKRPEEIDIETFCKLSSFQAPE